METHLENNKFYVPEISEFFVGFEYEQLAMNPQADISMSEDKWETHKFPDPFVGYRLDRLNLNNIRVKYLSQEDFEELGFEIKQWGAIKGDITVEFNIYNPQEDTIDIYCVNDLRFKGNIKNKSQLKFILKCLGIKE